MMYISQVVELKKHLDFMLDEATTQHERQQLLQEYEQDKQKAIGQANKALQATRLAFPNAGYYRTSDYSFAGHSYHEVDGPFNSLDAATTDINGRPMNPSDFRVEFLYQAPQDLGLNMIS